MQFSAPIDFPTAAPLIYAGVEAASRSIKIIVARRGSFDVDGEMRAAFVVGPRTVPLPVRYLGAPACVEWAVPPWTAPALLGVRGDEIAGRVVDLASLPHAPLRDALLRGYPDQMTIAHDALANWWAGRGRADARLAARVWAEVDSAPERPVANLADHLSVSERRLRQAVRREVGLSVTHIRRLVRHERAMRMLAIPAISLADAAYATGYADQSHMTREFTALSGVVPSRLRAALVAAR